MIFITMGNNIRNERKKQTLTQEQLAEKVAISAVFLSQIENGRKIPSLETVYNITVALGVTMENIFSENYEHINNQQINNRMELLLTDRTKEEKDFIFDITKLIVSKIDNNQII